ncbi:MAG: hypothetical protein WBE13_03335 [Candidatus Acidiferrum sp.]
MIVRHSLHGLVKQPRIFGQIRIIAYCSLLVGGFATLSFVQSARAAGTPQHSAAQARKSSKASGAAPTTNAIPKLGKAKMLLDANGKAYRWRIQPDAIVVESAEHGNGAAMDELGDRMGGRAGFSWYLRSALTGYLPGMMDTAAAYEKGMGTKADPAQARNWEEKLKPLIEKAWAEHDGHVDTQIAEHYSEGTAGLPLDAKEILKWVEHAASYGSVEGLEELAGITRNGFSTLADKDGKTVTLVPKATNAEQWLTYYREAAGTGDPQAELDLLNCLWSVSPASPSQASQAMESVQKAGAQGYPPALAELGNLSLAGGYGGRADLAFPKDNKQAMEWYTKALAAGNAWGLSGIVKMYLEGDGVTKNPRIAIAILKETASQNSWEVRGAMRDLWNIYASGDGVPADNNAAEYWMRKEAVASGQDAEEAELYAARNFAGIFTCGPSGKTCERLWDPARSFRLYGELARKNTKDATIAQAQFSLAQAYLDGEGVKEDDAQARHWFEKAHENGFANAVMSLGNLYQEGKGGARDYVQALALYQEAYGKGIDTAANSIGEMYAYGEGVQRDPLQALEWYEKAWKDGAGAPVAAYNIGKMYALGYGVKKDAAQAFAWYQKVSGNNLLYFADALVAIGDAYLQGDGVAKDLNKALNSYYRAGQGGNSEGLEKLVHLYMPMTGVNPAMNDENYAATLKMADQAVEQRADWASSYITSLIGGNPNRWEGYGLWGAMERKRGNTLEAEAAFKHALDLAPDDAKAQFSLALQQLDSADTFDKQLDAAVASWKSKQVPQAVIGTSMLLAGNPGRWEAYGLSAQIEQALGKTKEARFAYEQALGLAPENEKLQIAFALWRLDTAPRLPVQAKNGE